MESSPALMFLLAEHRFLLSSINLKQALLSRPDNIFQYWNCFLSTTISMSKLGLNNSHIRYFSSFVRIRYLEAWKLYTKKCINLQQQQKNREKQLNTILLIVHYLDFRGIWDGAFGIGLVYLALEWHIWYFQQLEKGTPTPLVALVTNSVIQSHSKL